MDAIDLLDARTTVVSRLGALARFVGQFYRVRSSHRKVSGLRPLLHTLLGYAVAAGGHAQLLIVNAAMVACLLLFFGAYGNYWDWRLLGEENSSSAASEHAHLSAALARALSVLPWVAILPLVIWARGLGLSPTAERLFWIVALLGALYMTPGIRLKARPGGFLIAVAGWFLLFLQGYAVQEASWTAAVMVLCGLLVLFQCHVELLHLLDDQLHSQTEPQYRSSRTLLRWLRSLPWVSCAASLAGAFVHPLFLNTTVWSLVRLRALRRLRPDELSARRRQLWHPIWSLYEFGIYAASGFLGVLS